MRRELILFTTLVYFCMYIQRVTEESSSLLTYDYTLDLIQVTPTT